MGDSLRLVSMAEHVEAMLLGTTRSCRRPGGITFQVLVHALVPAILVGAGGLDELGSNTEPQPPDAELQEAAEGTGGEGLAV